MLMVRSLERCLWLGVERVVNGKEHREVLNSKKNRHELIVNGIKRCQWLGV